MTITPAVDNSAAAEPVLPVSRCTVCDGDVVEYLDFGTQPLSDAFLPPDFDPADEFTYRLAVGRCTTCSMVQLTNEVPRNRMFHEDYPYHSSGSRLMREHFSGFATRSLSGELAGRPDPFVVEIGSNDGVMLGTIAAAGVRHLGVEPSGGVADLAHAAGVRVRKSFFEQEVAAEILAEDGPADLIFAANTFCHIPYVGSILRGVELLLADDGVFVFEDPYLGDILAKTSFDQIYDEHYFFFSAYSVQQMARRYGLELVDVERLPVHGGEVRYTLAKAGRRVASDAVDALICEEQRNRVNEAASLQAFGHAVDANRDALVTLLQELKARGKRVVGYGATAKSATVTNYCGITPDLVEFVVDSTPAKQNRLTPGAHIPVRESAAFGDPYPDYALLFAWNHAAEIMANEKGFGEAGGRWIEYVPDVRTS